MENQFQRESPVVKQFIRNLLTPWKMKIFMLTKVPGAFFFGLSIDKVTPERAEVSVPYRWSSKNPFQSIYFVAQCAAAEMSTAVLAMVAMEGRGKIAMLVTHSQMTFSKKATTRATFTCEDGLAAQIAIQKAIDTGEGQTADMTSVGRNTEGQIVSEMKVTWSFKVKS